MAWCFVGFRRREMTPTTLRPAPVAGRRLSEATSIYVEAARRRLSQDPSDVDALFTLAVWHAILGDTRRSLALLHRATRRAPGIRGKDIASSMGVTPPTVSYHLRRLVDRAAVRARRHGMAVRYYPASNAGTVSPDPSGGEG